MLKILCKSNMGKNNQVQMEIQKSLLALQDEARILKSKGKKSTYTDERGSVDQKLFNFNYDDKSFIRGFGTEDGLNPLKSTMGMYGMPTSLKL